MGVNMGQITKEQYLEAIWNLKLAMTQLKPNGNNQIKRSGAK